MKFRSFLEYYENEMNYLIESGQDLKKMYPSMSNLDFSNESNDPDVKKLIEGTAFLNANLQKRIDEKNQELSQEILNSIYPYFNRPTPSISVFQVQNANKVCVLPQYSEILSNQSYNGEIFKFLTTHAIKLSSYKIIDIKKINTQNLPREIAKITESAIEITVEKEHQDLEKEMILYINKMESAAFSIYETLFTFNHKTNTPVYENNEQIGEIEFMDDYLALPMLKNENNCYNSVIEFNTFKEKFLFFKIKFKKEPKNKIQIPIKKDNEINVSTSTFLLNCAIGVNLIEKTSDPIHITHKSLRYKLFIKDNIDVYAIYGIKNINNPSQNFQNYFSLNNQEKQTTDISWYYKRDNNISTSLFLYFFDDSFEAKTVYCKMLCLQKYANELISENEEWKISNHNLKCINIKKPSKYFSNTNHTDSQRKLITHLNLNYFGISSEEALKNIKALFDIYANTSSSYHYLNQVSKIEFETKMVPERGVMIPKIFVKLKVNSEAKGFFIARIISKLIMAISPMNKKIGITLIKAETGEIWKEWSMS